MFGIAPLLAATTPLDTRRLPPSGGEEPAKIRATIARAAIFAQLPIAAIEDLAARMTTRRVGTSVAIVRQDEPGDALFLIVSGRVKAVVFGSNGREVLLASHRVGDSFGELSVLDGGVRSSTCVALEPTSLLVLSREHLLAHMQLHPQTALNMMSELSKRVRKSNETIAQLALYDVNERLVHQLVALAKEDGQDTAEGVLVRRRPTQQELANMVGSCRETISRAFNQLVRRGAIISRGRAMIVTPQLLQAVAKVA